MALDNGEVVTYDSQEENEAYAYGKHLFYVRLLDVEQLISH